MSTSSAQLKGSEAPQPKETRGTAIQPEATQSETAQRETPRTIARLSDVTYIYENGTIALDGISLEIPTGQRTCIVGANGSGKSTLASILCGLSAPDSGSVMLAGEKVFADGKADFTAYAHACRQLGLVFQNPEDQIVTSLVDEDIAFGPENLQVPSAKIDSLVRRELKRVAMTDFAQRDPSTLSGGQLQRVAIAGALAMDPKLLVLDEPSASLDAIGRRGVMKLVKKLCQDGCTITHITHFMDEVVNADQVIALDHGHVAFAGPPANFFIQQNLVASLELEEPFEVQLQDRLREKGFEVPWTLDSEQLKDSLMELLAVLRSDSKTKPTAGTTAGNGAATATTAATGAATAAATNIAAESAKKDLVAVSHATQTFGVETGRKHKLFSTRAQTHRSNSIRALDDVSFTLQECSSTAIIGATGSGKSTLARLLCALSTPDSGTIVINGYNTSSRRHRKLLHGIVGFVMQRPERQLFAESVFKDVAFGPENLGLSPQDVNARVVHALELAGLQNKADVSPFELSGGQQRLCAVAGVLAMQPRILVLDEPTAGLDPHARAKLRALLDQVKSSGATLIEITHSMDDAALADRLIVLSQGSIVGNDTPLKVFTTLGEKYLRQIGLSLPKALIWADALAEATSTNLGRPLTLDELTGALFDALDGDA